MIFGDVSRTTSDYAYIILNLFVRMLQLAWSLDIESRNQMNPASSSQEHTLYLLS